MRPELQIWRQTGPDNYTKIGCSSVTANATASPNVHEYYPNTTLEFQQGDILGVYHPSNSSLNLYEQLFGGSLSYVEDVDFPSANISISNLRMRPVNHFPLVSVVISKLLMKRRAK